MSLLESGLSSQILLEVFLSLMEYFFSGLDGHPLEGVELAISFPLSEYFVKKKKNVKKLPS